MGSRSGRTRGGTSTCAVSPTTRCRTSWRRRESRSRSSSDGGAATSRIPYGQFDRRVQLAAERAGYDAARRARRRRQPRRTVRHPAGRPVARRRAAADRLQELPRVAARDAAAATTARAPGAAHVAYAPVKRVTPRSAALARRRLRAPSRRRGAERRRDHRRPARRRRGRASSRSRTASRCSPRTERDDPTFAFKWSIIGDTYGHEQKTRATRRAWYLERFGYGDEEHARRGRARQARPRRGLRQRRRHEHVRRLRRAGRRRRPQPRGGGRDVQAGGRPGQRARDPGRRPAAAVRAGDVRLRLVRPGAAPHARHVHVVRGDPPAREARRARGDLRVPREGADPGVRRRLHPRADDEDERRGLLRLLPQRHRARPRAHGRARGGRRSRSDPDARDRGRPAGRAALRLLERR